MKLGIAGDLHLTNRSPIMRVDNYWETLCRKLDQVIQIFKEERCGAAIQPGDFCDTPTVANRVISRIISMLQEDEKWYCVFGQHDITGHSKSTLPNSPLAILEAAGVLNILDDRGATIFDQENKQRLHLYGASFGQEVPKPLKSDHYNILVTHRMIGDRELYPGQELTGPRSFLRKNSEYDLIICGDYHYRFIETWQGKTILNPGAIVRKTRSKFDLQHKPAVIIFDTETNESKVIELEVEPIEKVFDLRETKKRSTDSLLKFINGLKDRGEKVAGWKHILVQVLNERKSGKDVKQVIDDCLEEINSGKS